MTVLTVDQTQVRFVYRVDRPGPIMLTGSFSDFFVPMFLFEVVLFPI